MPNQPKNPSKGHGENQSTKKQIKDPEKLKQYQIKQIANEYLDELIKQEPSIKKLVEKDRAKIEQRIITAMQYYTNGDPSLLNNPKFLKSHMNGIDFNRNVEVVEIPAGTSLNQFQMAGKGIGETRQGNYYALEEYTADHSQDAFDRGIADTTLYVGHNLSDSTELDSPGKTTKTKDEQTVYASDKQVVYYTATEKVTALKSSTRAIDDTWSNWVSLGKDKSGSLPMRAEGGGTQLYIDRGQNAKIASDLSLKFNDAILNITSSMKTHQNFDAGQIEDTLNTHLMVLFNRASFLKNNDKLVEAYMKLKLACENASTPELKAICENALQTAESAMIQRLIDQPGKQVTPEMEAKAMHTLETIIAKNYQKAIVGEMLELAENTLSKSVNTGTVFTPSTLQLSANSSINQYRAEKRAMMLDILNNIKGIQEKIDSGKTTPQDVEIFQQYLVKMHEKNDQINIKYGSSREEGPFISLLNDMRRDANILASQYQVEPLPQFQIGAERENTHQVSAPSNQASSTKSPERFTDESKGWLQSYADDTINACENLMGRIAKNKSNFTPGSLSFSASSRAVDQYIVEKEGMIKQLIDLTQNLREKAATNDLSQDEIIEYTSAVQALSSLNDNINQKYNRSQTQGPFIDLINETLSNLNSLTAKLGIEKPEEKVAHEHINRLKN